MRQLGTTSFVPLGAVMLSALLAVPACGLQTDAGDPAAALREGRYDDAIQLYETRVARTPSDVAAYRGLVRSFMTIGRHEHAERAARAGSAPDAAGIELLNTLGAVLYARGQVAEAEAAFRAAIDGRASDVLDARLNLGALLHRRGERAAAYAIFDSFIDIYNRGGATTSAELAAVGTALRYLGARQSDHFRGALRAYGEAFAANPGAHEPRILMGDLLLDRYNGTEAQAVYGEVLAVNPSHPRALLGMARAKRFDGAAGEAFELVRRALDVNPNLVPARVFLARLHLEAEDHDAAAGEAGRALDVNPASLEALAVLAAAHYLDDDTAAYEATVTRVLALDPHYAELFAGAAELAARQRRYADAVQLAERAVALDSMAWSGWAALGLSQLRIGRFDAARVSLETAFTGDPYNVWVKNTLDLLDTYPSYQSRSTERFELFLHEDEAGLLFPYMSVLAERAYDRLSERYDYRPETPVRVEVYPRHADFSVRTLGLVGLGALGVSFGNVLAMDSPAARDAGSFNWGSTLWHEISHAFTLGATGNRVPRWLTEGLAVLDERRAREGWGDDVTYGFLLAFERDELLPIARLNDGFVRPSHPRQVEFSYYQASLAAEWIEREQGVQAIRDMLHAYGDGATTEQVFERVLGTTLEAFDRGFEAWLRERFATPLAAIQPRPTADDEASAPPVRPPSPAEAARLADSAPDDFAAQLAAGRALFDAERFDDALPYFERARDLFPEYAETGSPYRYIAAIHERAGAPRAAVDALRQLVALNESAYEATLDLARLLADIGERAGAAAALERAVHIYPYELDLHRELAEHYAAVENWPGEVRERQAVLALEPVDRANALYRLALAHFNGGDASAARIQVLRALEIAPSFAEAQELLLSLHDRPNRPETP